MSSAHQDRVGIKRIDSLHFFVRDLERSRDHYVRRLDFSETAVSGPEFELEHSARASLVEAGNVRFVFMAPLGSEGESSRWLANHPEGVGRVVLEVEDIERAFEILLKRGATPITGIEQGSLAGRRAGPEALVTAHWFDIATAFGDTLFRFIEKRGSAAGADEAGMLPGLVRVAADPGRDLNRFGISEIDHVTSNFLTLKPAIMWMEQVLGLERYWGIEFHTQDVAGQRADGARVEGGSGLKSIVMWDPASGIKFANNEPAAPAFYASQIYRFCLEHRGAGVQHVALSVRDIVATVRDLRGLGVDFMPTPPAYYDLLPARLIQHGIERIDEEIETLRGVQILVDGDGPSQYLLQIFLREAAGLFGDPNAGPLFIELIERKGDSGFGAGNFRALFESIEREQATQRAA